MALSEYKRKRTFKKTPEPVGASRTQPTKQLRFVVQEHHASHLHYDFRLEFDGVLKSWAVPKGPSMNPNDKRLAMEVEDHPLDYINFSGTIPKGNYGAGEVYVWDKGVYHSSETIDEKENIKKLKFGYHKGHIKIVLLGGKLKGGFALVKIKENPKNKNAWLLIKEKDEYAVENKLEPKGKVSAKRGKNPMPHDISPMLATLTDKPFDKPGWFYEIKWDGYRAIAEVESGKVKLYSRRGNSLAADYPPIVDALKKVKNTLIFDGEIIALKNGRPDFHTLQNYGIEKAPLQYVIFDLLYINGEDLRDMPLRERKARLVEIFPEHPNLIISEHIEEKGEDFLKKVTAEKFEGIMAKDSSSRYLEGKRGESWFKIKSWNEQEAIICGFTEPRGSRKKIGALVLGAHENGMLKYIGHSGGGFTQKELEDVHKILEKITTTKSPFTEKVPINSPITWVKPEYVCQIKFSEWTEDGRMRHPIYAGLRKDKKAKEVIIEKPDIKSESVKAEPVKAQTMEHQEKSQKKSQDKPHFTHLDKVYFPKEGITKGDIIAYYEKISEIILPYLKDRPESLNRHPHGIEGQSFFQKDFTMNVPDFIQTHKVWSESNDKEINYLLCQNQETLLYLANLGCIELNPWNSRIQSLEKPDYMIIDLDPGDTTFDDLLKVVKAAHEVLIDACEEHLIKTSGKRGIHIMVPLGAKYDYDTVRIFSELLVHIIHKKIPDITSLERSPAKRKDKIYLDWLQNRRGQTIAAPYSVRPAPGAPVSTPLRFEEIKKGLDPKKFTIETIFKRLEKYGDLMKPLLEKKVDLEESMKCLEKMKLA